MTTNLLSGQVQLTNSAPKPVASVTLRARQKLPWTQLLWTIAVVVVNHWLVADLFALTKDVPRWDHAARWLLLMLSLGGFFTGAAWLHGRRLAHHRNHIWAFVLALACADMTGLVLHDLIHSFPRSLSLLAGVPLLFLAVRQLQDWKHEWTTLVTLSRKLSREQIKDKPIRQLVLFVSPPSNVPEVPESPTTCHAILNGKDKEPIRLIGKLEDDVKKLSNHNWQQILRAIQPHQNNLQDVFLVGSPDMTGLRTAPRPPGEKAEFTEGSHLYLPVCERFLKPYLPGVQVHQTRAVDFENSEDLVPLLQEIEHEALKKVQPSGFAIDVTGGQKTNSIVAAALTLLGESCIQYVQTAPRLSPPSATAQDGPAIEAYLYDLRLDFPAEM